MYDQVTPVVDLSLLGLCRRAYHGHPKGCPNWDKKGDCPPRTRPLGEVIDLNQPVYAIWNVFDLQAHVEKMSDRHPEWSWRQLVNCLYWQGTARKHLRQETRRFESEHPGHL